MVTHSEISLKFWDPWQFCFLRVTIAPGNCVDPSQLYLCQIQQSENPKAQQILEPQFCAYLIYASVVIYMLDRSRNSKKLYQFSI